MSHEIVIAHYDEDLTWLTRLPLHWSVTIYHKGGKTPQELSIPRPAEVYLLDNEGREGHSFLTHIIRRYDSLSAVTLFVQGNPFDHVSISRLEEVLAGMYDERVCEPVMSNEWFPSQPAELLACDHWGAPHHPGLDLQGFARTLGLALPDQVAFAPGAQWLVGAARLRQHAASFWYRVRRALLSPAPGETDFNPACPMNGFCLERLWPLLWRWKKVSVLLYTHHTEAEPTVPETVLTATIASIRRAAGLVSGETFAEVECIASVRRPLTALAGDWTQVPAPRPTGRTLVDIYEAVRSGLRWVDAESTVFLAEHDVLYPEQYYRWGMVQARPGRRLNYATNVLMLNAVGYWSYRPASFQSTCFGDRDALLADVERRLAHIESGYEPMTIDLGKGSDMGPEAYEFYNPTPVLDIRHGGNTTPTGTIHTHHTMCKSSAYWGPARELASELGLAHTHGKEPIWVEEDALLNPNDEYRARETT